MLQSVKSESPLFSKTADFLVWLQNHLQNFPKHQRFRLVRRIDDAAFNFYELLIKATRSQKKKRVILLQADVELEKLRAYFRLARRCKYTTPKQYHHVAKVLTELGRLLGSWLKTT